MQLSASDVFGYYRPSPCWERIALREQGLDEAPPGPYDEVIRRLGQGHEQRHLQTFPAAVDLRPYPFPERAVRTKEAIRNGVSVVYQGLLTANVTLGGVNCQVVGVPDFLIRDGRRGCIIRDSKMSRRIDEKDHPEILLQMSMYGWLYRQTFRESPLRLQIHSGTGEIVEVTHDSGVYRPEAEDSARSPFPAWFRQISPIPKTRRTVKAETWVSYGWRYGDQ